ncbi:STAS domain-containing protein [Desertifilum sp. FACHB-1129]|uniref:Anti-sigma factor antagonist n=2 Tax=Desertifilum tharense IPPAS B-1220 TaxID=1781255 RepID=A0A1E5QMK0_9CYAN|nr:MULTISPECIES: STAS domain-containing protein [Desertifilum]MCD8489026.1 STAS domain-containing protein [Desertifilum sp.]MDA0212784.1 STAS domain-containing protein [Cyanobacteria bacterium FC1]MDI9636421.1 STAS domain-containing protein [Geitlerinema splendidum]MDK3156522.1 STAS domain-containing protein [Kamptonema cortianum]MBD2313394.1 STAS domain-containing protein [Desertifilum sp. FACHB-1129]
MSRVVKKVQPSGILDSTKASQFREEISHLVSSGADIILVNLKDVTFVDSSGLGALVSALKIVRSSSGKLCLCSINEQVRMLFELTSMDRVFEVYPSEDDFLSAIEST